MSDKSNKSNKKIIDYLLGTLLTIPFIIQFFIMFLFSNELNLFILVIIGYVVWGFSIYFGFISFRVFKKKGDVDKGKSYIYTTKLVDSGPYSLIRHPQYLGMILITISITLWSQILLSLILTITIIIVVYRWSYMEEKDLLNKFGVDYKEYKRRVTRLNPILGIIKILSNRK